MMVCTLSSFATCIAVGFVAGVVTSVSILLYVGRNSGPIK